MDKPRIILHLGGNKTGTTALQSTLYAQRQILAAHGILYPDLKILDESTRSHWPLAVAFMNKPHEYYLLKDREIGKAEADDFTQNVLDRLDSQISGAGCQVVILSSEALSMLEDDELVRFRNYFKTRYGDVTAIYFGREPAASLISFYQQALVGGENVLLENLVNTKNLKFGTISESLARVFGGDLKVRKFDRESLLQGDLIADFLLRHVGYKGNAVAFQKKRDNNIALSAPSAALIYFLNKKVRRRKNDLRNPVFFDSRLFAKRYDREHTPPKLTLPNARWAAYIRLTTRREWIIFLKNAKLDADAENFLTQLRKDAADFGQLEPPHEQEVEAWMRDNASMLDLNAVPAAYREPFEKALAESLSQTL